MFLKKVQSTSVFNRFIYRFFSITLLLFLSGSHLAPIPLATQGVQTPQAEGAVQLTQDQAIAAALNDLESIADGYRLQHPRHTATFTPQGLTFAPKQGGLAWQWRLTAVTAGAVPVAGAVVDAVIPVGTGSARVAYERGALVEQYLALGESIEQQFVIPQPLLLAGADLVIEGVVQSAGRFQEVEDGWRWSTWAGGVHLGDVRVIDAAGQELPASMQVTASATRIVVDGAALAGAAYPVTVDPEIGANDFRLSDMGHDGCTAVDPAVVYNSTDNEYLVVWGGDDDTGGLVISEFEIYGQRVDGSTGAEIGGDFRLSDMGPDGDTGCVASDPAVAYNELHNEYLVVWQGNDDACIPSSEEFEIYGQRVEADGDETGINDFRISHMGPDGNTDYEARDPAVVGNSTDGYLVVWSGDDNTSGLVNNEFEIYGAQMSYILGPSSSLAVGPVSRLSDMGPDGSTTYGAYEPAVAYNSDQQEYLVVWEGDDNTGDLVDSEFEIYGQRVSWSGQEIGINDFRLSDMGPDGDDNYAAHNPAVAYNSLYNDYLVVWWGDDTTDGEFEIYGQWLNGDGSQLDDDLRLSDMGPDGNDAYDAENPAVAYNSANNEYLVVWEGRNSLLVNAPEIFGQRVDGATGAETGTNDFYLSDMGPSGSPSYFAHNPAVAYSSTDNEYLVVWWGSDNTGTLGWGELEIFGQRVVGGTGTEIGSNDFRLSDMGSDLTYDAYNPAVAYNSVDNEYLVVWTGDDNTGTLVDEEFEIYGQRVNAATGAEIGRDFLLSHMGVNGDVNYDAYNPAVAYNSIDNEYLVVWWGDDNTGTLVNGELEIYGQRVDADGVEIGGDIRLSDMGPDGNTGCYAQYPDVAYNSTDNEYLVVWEGNNGLFVNAREIFGQRLDGATGVQIGTNDFYLSDMGPSGNADYAAYESAVAYNSTDNEYMVVWHGDDATDGEFEVYGQRVNAATGAEIGVNDIRLSDMGPDGNADYDAGSPAVAYNSANNEYLVVWEGRNSLLVNAREIFGQRVNAAGAEIGTNDFYLSDMGPPGNADCEAHEPAVTYNSKNNEYLVVWEGRNSLFIDTREIFGQRVTAAGTEVGTNDFYLSDMGPPLTAGYNAHEPQVAYNSTDGEYLAVWWGDDNRHGLVDDEFEIFGQRFSGAETYVYLPLVLR